MKNEKAEPDKGFMIKNEPSVPIPVNKIEQTKAVPLPAVSLPQKNGNANRKFRGDPNDPSNYKTAEEYEAAMHQRYPMICAAAGWKSVWYQNQREKRHGQLPDQIAQSHAAALKNFYAGIAGSMSTVSIKPKARGFSR